MTDDRTLVERLATLDDEMMCFDGNATYALIDEARRTIERQAAEIAALREYFTAVEQITGPYPAGELDGQQAWRRVVAAHTAVKALEDRRTKSNAENHDD